MRKKLPNPFTFGKMMIGFVKQFCLLFYHILKHPLCWILLINWIARDWNDSTHKETTSSIYDFSSILYESSQQNVRLQNKKEIWSCSMLSSLMSPRSATIDNDQCFSSFQTDEPPLPRDRPEESTQANHKHTFFFSRRWSHGHQKERQTTTFASNERAIFSICCSFISHGPFFTLSTDKVTFYQNTNFPPAVFFSQKLPFRIGGKTFLLSNFVC